MERRWYARPRGKGGNHRYIFLENTGEHSGTARREKMDRESEKKTFRRYMYIEMFGQFHG